LAHGGDDPLPHPDRDGLDPDGDPVAPHRIALADDATLLDRGERERRLLRAQGSPHLIVLVHRLRRVGAHLRHHDETAALALGAHEEEVREGQIGQQLPLRHQPGEVLGLVLVERRPLGDELREVHPSRW
jgi:hypothetical protein